jgi:outer membrane immunogenic protein
MASAADMPLKAGPMAPPPPNWTGCYLDAGWGYGMSNTDEFTTFPGVPTSNTITVGGRGWLGRFGGGCDYQFGLGGLGNFVVGAFGDYDFMGLSGQNPPPDGIGGGVFANPGVGTQNEEGAWYAGGRIGYLVTPALMTYFEGGWTQTRFNQLNLTNLVIGAPAIGVSLPATTYNGGFVGGGTEYALNFSWLPIHGLFWRNEWRYAWYDGKNLGFFTTATGVPTGLLENEKPQVQTVTTSLVWRFNWLGQ